MNVYIFYIFNSNFWYKFIYCYYRTILYDLEDLIYFSNQDNEIFLLINYLNDYISLKDDVTDLIGKDDNNNYKYEIKIDKIEAPIKKGQKVGILILKSNEKKISEFDIVSLESVKKANYIDYYKKNLKNFITGLN